ncbi:hypothetical protein [Clostridium cellulovorans]|uniref:Uncharacterized protein n=1 Tax=Clostridium cellulovorans (strain ATCC 35296 / DSM 3052 / OCM 3 / 743B) TaxID=573061 RepID=D9SPI5_CLOC7|nr:hypothetical protein [Clostridium cellulovorans]ADL50034.1 hypothetical protein Clocel_0250 [Clostridium cellulovorans 743B]
MKKRKYIYLLITILIISVAILAPRITYRIDSNLVNQDKKPIFVVKKDLYKDGGTTDYRGLGYQVIAWNRITANGTESGYEIYKSPNFRDVNDGPTKELKIVTDK